MFLLATDTIIAWAAVVGICLAIFGASRRLAYFLIGPAVVRWLVAPAIVSMAPALLAVAEAHWLWFLPVIMIAPFLLVRAFAAILEGALRVLLGPRVGTRAAGHVGGVLGVRLIDWALGRRRGRPIPEFEAEEEG